MFAQFENFFKLEIDQTSVKASLIVEEIPPKDYLKTLYLDYFRRYLIFKGIKTPLICPPVLAWLLNNFTIRNAIISQGSGSLFDYFRVTAVPFSKEIRQAAELIPFEVEEGQTIFRLTPSETSFHGTDLFGKPLAGAVESPHFFFGPNINVESRDAGWQAIAGSVGMVSCHDSHITLKPHRIIDGDVGPQTGNIDFDGHLTINGEIMSNFKINATGTIVVKGVIEGATIFSHESIYAHQGVLGLNRARLIAMGNISGKEFKDAYLLAAGRLYGELGFLNCQAYSLERIATGKNGRITGGNTNSVSSIETAYLGSPDVIKTSISISSDPFVSDQAEELIKLLKIVSLKIQNQKKNIEYLQKKISFSFPDYCRTHTERCAFIHDQMLLEGNKKFYNQLQQFAYYEFQLIQLHTVQQNILDKIQVVRSSGLLEDQPYLKVHREIYPSLTIKIANCILFNTEIYQNAVFMLHDNQVVRLNN